MHLTKISALGLALLAFSACKKETQDASYSTDNALAEAAFGDIYSQINQTAESDGNLRNGCTTITIDTTSPNWFPATVTLDFGAGCLGTDNRVRSGKLIAVFSGRWRDVGTTITVTPDNYRTNGSLVEGQLTLTNLGPSGNTNPRIGYVVVNGKVTDASGDVIEWERNNVYEWVAGSTTSYATNGEAGVLDDVWHITGTGSGVTRNGNAYTAEITETVEFAVGCQWRYTDGRIEILPDGLGASQMRFMDFGDGTCDNKLTVGVGTYSYEVILQ